MPRARGDYNNEDAQFFITDSRSVPLNSGIVVAKLRSIDDNACKNYSANNETRRRTDLLGALRHRSYIRQPQPCGVWLDNRECWGRWQSFDCFNIGVMISDNLSSSDPVPHNIQKAFNRSKCYEKFGVKFESIYEFVIEIFFPISYNCSLTKRITTLNSYLNIFEWQIFRIIGNKPRCMNNMCKGREK